jgi:hypothetical protein
MTELTHDVSVCDSARVELETSIEAARVDDRESLGQALSSKCNDLVICANQELEPAMKAKGNASDLVPETARGPVVSEDRPAPRNQRRGGPQALDAAAGSNTEGTWSNS